MRFGLISHVVGEAEGSAVLRDNIELAQVAEESGFDSFWVAQHHFGAHRAHAPSPLILLAAIARETDHIGLGTAVIAAALEEPIRLAEDAAMVDCLSDGRLQLGVGAGADPEASRVFGIDHGDRHRVLKEKLITLCDELRGERLRPKRSELLERMWLATGSDEGYHLAAELGLGILAGRRGSPNRAEDMLTASRLAEFRRQMLTRGHYPRTGLSRVVFCADDVAAAHAALAPGIDRWINDYAPPGRFPEGYSVEDYLATGHIFTGPATEVLDRIQRDPCFPHTSDLLMNIPQMYPDLRDNIDSVRKCGAGMMRGVADLDD